MSHRMKVSKGLLERKVPHRHRHKTGINIVHTDPSIAHNNVLTCQLALLNCCYRCT
jgi:hypothetical protein